MDYSSWLLAAKEIRRLVMNIPILRYWALCVPFLVLALIWKAPDFVDAAARMWPPATPASTESPEPAGTAETQ